ncbi:unnamed protein product, partial [Mesorhabditis belari]|uniref:Uncharacterized protein n=1 Tax=Mesorhabditis belari TaxID=2138241 RepID=A0AAF3FE32_9BILA
MLLQYEDQAEFDTAYRLNLCAEFEDALKFGNFVETLTRVAGYHQVQHPDCELSTNATSDSENEDDMGESDIRENILNQHHIVESGSEKEMNPLIKLTEGQPFRQTRLVVPLGVAFDTLFATSLFKLWLVPVVLLNM